MRYIVYLFLIFSTAFGVSQNIKTKPFYRVDMVPKHMDVKTKKKRFYYLIVPVVQKVHKELMLQHDTVLKDMKNSRNRREIQELKKVYKIVTDRELLLALKPHPQSIVLAQAAIESAWATSRFFTKANNIFGVWSTNRFQKRIAAKEKRDGGKTVWLRKFDTLEDSVRQYYKMIATAKVYKEFRQLRYETDNIAKLVRRLDRYSETGDEYTKKLLGITKYNKLIKYDR
jgi:Bax protein